MRDTPRFSELCNAGDDDGVRECTIKEDKCITPVPMKRCFQLWIFCEFGQIKVILGCFSSLPVFTIF